MKKENGITLIALIITVIILLILAGTAISIAINGGDIFGKASQARAEWNEAVAEEESELNKYIRMVNGEFVTLDMMLEFINNDDVCWNRTATEYTETLKLLGYYSGNAGGTQNWLSYAEGTRVFRCSIDDNIYIVGYTQAENDDDIEMVRANWDGTVTLDNGGEPISFSTPYGDYQLNVPGYNPDCTYKSNTRHIFIHPPFNSGAILLYNIDGKLIDIQWED